MRTRAAYECSVQGVYSPRRAVLPGLLNTTLLLLGRWHGGGFEGGLACQRLCMLAALLAACAARASHLPPLCTCCSASCCSVRWWLLACCLGPKPVCFLTVVCADQGLLPGAMGSLVGPVEVRRPRRPWPLAAAVLCVAVLRCHVMLRGCMRCGTGSGCAEGSRWGQVRCAV